MEMSVKSKISSEPAPEYNAESVCRRRADDATIAKALEILDRRFKRESVMASPRAASDFCTLHFAGSEVEKFAALMLDTQHQLIKLEVLATGTIDGAAVYPREVVKAALTCNAAAVIFTHNHPSGITEPSAADRVLTDRLKAALATVDIRVLDHFVVGQGRATSFAERGWL